MRDAMSLLDRVISFAGKDVTGDQIAEILGVADRRWLHNLVASVLEHDAATALTIVNDVHQYGFDVQHFAAELARFLRDLMVIRVSGAGEQLTDLSKSEFETLVELGGRRSPDDLLAIFRVALRAAEEVAHSRFPKLVLEMAVIRMAGLRPLQPLDELLARLEELERKLPDGFVLPTGSVQPPTPRAEAPSTRGPATAPSPAPRTSLRLVQEEEEAPEPARPVPIAPEPPRALPQAPAAQTPAPPAPSQQARVEAPPAAPAETVPAANQRLVEPASLRPFEAWLVETDPPLSGELAQARLSTEGGVLEVGFKNDLFLSRFQDGSPAWIRLRGCVERFFGEGTRFRIRILDRSLETTFERHERERAARLVKRKAEAERHPAVATVIAAFDGRVRDIRVQDGMDDFGAPDVEDEQEAP